METVLCILTVLVFTTLCLCASGCFIYSMILDHRREKRDKEYHVERMKRFK